MAHLKFFLSIFLLLTQTSCSIFGPTRTPATVETKKIEPPTVLEIEFLKKHYQQNVEKLRNFQPSEKFEILRIPVLNQEDFRNGAEFKAAIQLKSDDEDDENGDDIIYDIIERMEKNNIFKKFVLETLTLEQRKWVLSACNSSDFRVGRFIDPASYNFSTLCYGATGNVLFSPEELHQALLTFPETPEGVEYFGAEVDMKYSSPELLTKVQMIAHFLLLDKETFKEIFFSMTPDERGKFLINNYLSTEESKVEPFDLVLHSFTKRYNAYLHGYYKELSQPVDFTTLKRIAKKALAHTILISKKDDIYAWESPDLSIIKNRENFVAQCANGYSESKFSHDGGLKFWTSGSPETGGAYIRPGFINYNRFSILEKWTLDTPLLQLLSDETLSLEFRCKMTNYTFKIKKKKTGSIPAPKPLAWGPEVHGLMTMALSQELHSKERGLLKNYLRVLEGWSLESDFEVVPSKEKFEEIFNKADIYIPVSHAMDVNYFLVATEKSNYLLLSRIFEDGGVKRKVFLHLLVPHKGAAFSNSLTYNVKELSRLYSKRRKSGKGSLFLLNLSCASASTLTTWTFVYRESVDLDIARGRGYSLKDFPDLPYIIGSKVSFDSSTTASLATHINYPMESIKILAEGGTPREVVEFLQKPNSGDFVDKMVQLIKEINSEKAKEQNFSPLFNLDMPKLMSYGGYSLTVINQQTSENQTY